MVDRHGTGQMSASQSSRFSGDGVFDLTRTAVVMADRAGVAQGWTRGAERLLGYPVSEAVGRPLADLFAGVGAGSEQDGRWQTRLASADGWSGLEAVRHKDGHRLDLEFRVLPLLDARKDSVRLVLAAEMAQTPWSGASRSFLEGILGMSPIGVAMVNADLQFVWLNDALEEMGGTTRAQRLGKRLADIQPGLDGEAIEAEMRRGAGAPASPRSATSTWGARSPIRNGSTPTPRRSSVWRTKPVRCSASATWSSTSPKVTGPGSGWRC